MRILIYRLVCGISSSSRFSVRPSSVIRLRTMSSDKATAEVPLDKAPGNWFSKFNRAPDTPKDCFRGYSDRFNGITVDSSFEEKADPSSTTPDIDFATKLDNSLRFWKETKKRGVWFKVNLDNASWVPVLAQNGFKFHHAKDEFVMMYKWLPENETANIPPYAHTMIGVGAIVVNSKGQILAVSEKNALIPNSWKLPGGYAEPNENLPDAASREVLEETNITAKFESVVAIRHAHGTGFGCSDIYVVIAMRAESEEILKCEREIADCKWMEMEEFLTNENVHDVNRNFLRTFLSQKKQGVKIGCRDEVFLLLKRKYQIFDLVTEDKTTSSL